jgi:hypothetical protein
MNYADGRTDSQERYHHNELIVYYTHEKSEKSENKLSTDVNVHA